MSVEWVLPMNNEELTAIPAEGITGKSELEIPDYAIRRFARFLLAKMQEEEKSEETKTE